MAELQRRSGLSLRALYYLRDGRQPGTETMQALMRVFPELRYEVLFVPADSTTVQEPATLVKPGEAVAA